MGFWQSMRNFDLFSLPITLRFKENNNYKTPMGVVVSYIVVILSIIAISFFSQELVLKKNPEVSISSVNQQEPAWISLQPNELPLAIGLIGFYDWLPLQIDPKLFTIELILKQAQRNKDNEMIWQDDSILELQPCSLETNLKESRVKDKFVLPQRLYCLQPSQDLDHVMGGSFDNSELYSYIEVILRTCSQTLLVKPQLQDTIGTCAGQQVVKEKLENAYFMLQFEDFNLNSSNYHEPFIPYLRTTYTTVSHRASQLFEVFFEQTQLTDDDDLLFQSGNPRERYSMNEKHEMTMFDDTIMLQGVLYSSLSQLNVNRNYKKLQQVFAEIGGFLQLLFLFAAIFAKPIIRFHFQTNLLNSVYQFDMDNKKKYINNTVTNGIAGTQKQIQQQQQELSLKLADKYMMKKKGRNKIQINDRTQNKRKSAFLAKNQVTKATQVQKNLNDKLSVLELKMDQQSENQEKITLSFFQYFLFYLPCFLKDKKKKVKEAKKLILEKIDISFIINKLTEMEKLKYLLLNHNQMKLFDYIPKPQIDLLSTDEGLWGKDETNLYQKLFYYSQNHYDKVFDAFEAYMDMNQNKNQNQSGIDQQLITLMDNRMLQIFAGAKSNIDQFDREKFNSENPITSPFNQQKENTNIIEEFLGGHKISNQIALEQQQIQLKEVAQISENFDDVQEGIFKFQLKLFNIFNIYSQKYHTETKI